MIARNTFPFVLLKPVPLLRIRLRRIGKTGQPHYRIVVAEHSHPIKGRFVEIIGNYTPRGAKEVVVDKARLEYWLQHGAQPSLTVANLIKRAK